MKKIRKIIRGRSVQKIVASGREERQASEEEAQEKAVLEKEKRYDRDLVVENPTYPVDKAQEVQGQKMEVEELKRAINGRRKNRKEDLLLQVLL